MNESARAAEPRSGDDIASWILQSVTVDRVTAEVTTAFRAASIDSIVLKGPAIAGWLYTDGSPRLYADSDLLIRRGDWSDAQNVMRELGFDDSLSDLAHPRMESEAGYPWHRDRDRAEVDLHSTLFGLGASPDTVWDALSADAEEAAVGGAPVLMPSRPARLLHIVLHAVQHGGETPTAPMDALERRPMVDLERAVELAPTDTWIEARELADRLGAIAALAAGLALTPAGAALAIQLGIDSQSSAETSLRLAGVPMSEGFAELAAAKGLRAKLALLAREAFPKPAFMRWWSPLARRGRLGLFLIYCWRPIWLALHAGPGFLAWRRARRAG